MLHRLTYRLWPLRGFGPRLAAVNAMLALASAAAPLAAVAAPLEGCTSPGTCTAGLSSAVTAVTQYVFTNIVGPYPLPFPMVPGLNEYRDETSTLGTGALRAAVGEICFPCTVNPFHSSAVAAAQSGFGINRAEADTGFGTSGTDVRSATVHADVAIAASAVALSKWRDVWVFNSDGSFSANVALDGQADMVTGNALYPATFEHRAANQTGFWNYQLDVWDITNLRPDPDGFDAPTLVTTVGGGGRDSFASTLALSFNFTAGVAYFVTTRLEVYARDGLSLDLYHSARLQDVVLTGGAQLSALSGHDYLAPVPEPAPAVIWLGGLAGLALWSRRRPGAATAPGVVSQKASRSDDGWQGVWVSD